MWAVFLGVLIQFFWWAIPRILMMLGFYAVSAPLTESIFSVLRNQIDGQVSSVPGQFVNALYISGLLQGVTIILSACVFAAGIKATKAAASSLSQGPGGSAGDTGSEP